jgi:hypothetical protein
MTDNGGQGGGGGGKDDDNDNDSIRWSTHPHADEQLLILGLNVSTTTEDIGEEDNRLGGNPSHPISLL